MSFRLPSIARPALRLITVAALLAAAPAALYASSITYDIALSPANSSQVAGAGTITLASAPPSSGVATYTIANQQLQNITFTIGDQNFYLSGDPSATVTFTNGQLTQINFLQTVNSAPNRYTLELSNGFTLYGNGFGHAISSGSFAATPEIVLPDTTTSDSTNIAPASSPTPEPGSLVLLATALLLGGFFIFRRKRTAQSCASQSSNGQTVRAGAARTAL